MVRESLPLLIALSLPLAGMAGLLQGGGRDAGNVVPIRVSAPVAPAAMVPIHLPIAANPSPGPAPPGVWLNF